MKLTSKNMRLYAVSDRAWSRDDEDFLSKVDECLKSGVTIFQLREKNSDYEHFKSRALAIKPMCRRYGVIFIINDNVQLAKDIDADGVHIGQGDESIAQARKILGDEKIIGVSAHNVEEAVAAESAGADYLGCGAAFVTTTKTDAGAIKHETLKDITNAVNIPVIAIGGITDSNILTLCDLGLDGVAVVSAIFAQDNVSEATAGLRQKAEQVAKSTRKI